MPVPTLLNPLGIVGYPYSKRLSYIQSNRSQSVAVNLFRTISGNIKIYARFMRKDSSQYGNAFFFSTAGGTGKLQFDYDVLYYNSSYSSIRHIVPYNEMIEYRLDTYDGKEYINSTIYSFPRQSGSCNVVRFFTNYSIRFFSFDIFEDNEKIAALIPVLDQSSVPCLFDTVSRAFFYNSGSGQFSYE